MKLYHYIHCPFCIRVRLALDFLQIPYTSHVLQYDDEKTPIRLSGQKMLPIVEFGDGSAQNESLEIIARLDKRKILDSKDPIQNPDLQKWLNWLSTFSEDLYSLAMPFWALGPEFNASARLYFLKKKSAKRGDFVDLRQKRDFFEKNILKKLFETQPPILNGLKMHDIVLAAHLVGLYSVPRFCFPDFWNHYLFEVLKICRTDLEKDFDSFLKQD